MILSVNRQKRVQQVNILKQEHMKISLLLETAGTCPQISNSSLTMKDDNDNNVDNYEIVTINPSLRLDDESNLIAMCPNCAKKY